MEWQNVQQFIRIAMQFVGGFLVANGWVNEAGVEAIAGFVLSSAALVWWWWWNSAPVKK